MSRLLSWLPIRYAIVVYILLLTFGPMIFLLGWQVIRAPIVDHMSCGEFLRSTAKPIWANLQGCVLDYSRPDISGSIVRVNMHPTVEDALSSASMTSAAYQAVDPAMLLKSRKTLQFGVASEEARKALAVTTDLIIKKSAYSKSGDSNGRLFKDFDEYEPATLAEKPKWLRLKGFLAALCGLAFTLYSYYLVFIVRLPAFVRGD